MYIFVRMLIDDVLMAPGISVVTTFVIVLLIGMSTMSLLSGEEPEIEED